MRREAAVKGMEAFYLKSSARIGETGWTRDELHGRYALSGYKRLIYAIDFSPEGTRKSSVAPSLIRCSISDGTGGISVQVLQKFYVTANLKITEPLSTNMALERLMQEARHRTPVFGAFLDGQSALMLVAARLRHIAGA